MYLVYIPEHKENKMSTNEITQIRFNKNSKN